MRYAKLLGKGAAYVALGGAAVIALLAIAALTPRRWSFPENPSCDLTSDGFHTNFIVPVETPVFNWRQHLDLDKIANIPSQNYRFLQFGWGDRVFYVETPSWDQVSPLNAARALFYWNNASAMFVKGHETVPRFPTDEVKCLRLSNNDYLALMDYIDGSFQMSDRGEKQRIASGQDQQSGFYAANRRYSVFNTCNTWTANGLRVANVNTPLWGGLAKPIMFHLRNGCECSSDR